MKDISFFTHHLPNPACKFFFRHFLLHLNSFCSYITTSDSLDFSGIFGSAATGIQVFSPYCWKYYSPPQIYTFSGYPGNIIGSLIF
jgi:hypothetical protein